MIMMIVALRCVASSWWGIGAFECADGRTD